MPTIIGLRGIGNTGKTNTIHILRGMMLANGHKQALGGMQMFGKDFLDFLTKYGALVGITSAGDTKDFVHARLLTLTQEYCDVIVCACRTRGGTYDAVQAFPGYDYMYIDKKIAQSVALQQQANKRDANNLLVAINQLI